MGFLVFLLFFSITMIIVLGFNGDQWFPSKYPASFYDDEDWDDDDDESDTFNSNAQQEKPKAAPKEPMLYGGIPYQDGQLFFEDDGDAFL